MLTLCADCHEIIGGSWVRCRPCADIRQERQDVFELFHIDEADGPELTRIRFAPVDELY